MNSFVVIFFVCTIVFAFTQAAAPVASIPKPIKTRDYSEQIRVSAVYPESRVTITVGEKNGFQYTANGVTHSLEKIAVSGEYYNNEITQNGHAWLFLVVESGIGYSNFRFTRGNTVEFFVENFKFDQFYFEVIPPYVVPVDRLVFSQVNETAILVSGPSRSLFYNPYPRRPVIGKEIKAFSEV